MPNENDSKGGWLSQALSPNRLSPDEMYNISKRNAVAIKQDEGITGNRWIDNFFGGIGSQFLGGIGDTATFVGANNVGNFFNSGRDWIEERLEPAMPAEFSLDYLTSPTGLARATGNTFGSIASILAPTALLPGGAVGAIGRGVQAIPKIGKLFSSASPEMIGRWFASGVPEAAMEAGNWYRNSIANGMDPNEAWDKRWGVFGRNAAFLPISNATQWGLFSKALKGKNILSGFGELGSQAVEEGMQEGVTRDVSGLPFTYNPLEMITNPKYADQLQAMKEGVAGFALPTALGIGAGIIRDSKNRTDEQGTDTAPATETNEYRGEGGAGKDVTWVTNDGVSLDRAQPGLLDAIDTLAKKFSDDNNGLKLVVTSGNDGHSHAAGDHDHYQGWKVDIADAGANGVGINEDGALFTKDFQPTPYLWEFVEFGQRLGLGMNIEDLGKPNVHIDVTLDGTQWADKNGQRLDTPQNFGGFNSKGGTASTEQQENSYDSNFTDRQNEIWQMAQYASKRLRDEYQIRLAPELIYKQWALEDGGDFTHPTRNWGGLKDTAGNFRSFASDKEYADAYVDDFMRLRPEINDVTDENGMASDEAFTQVMLDTGYITQGDYENYIKGLPNISAPKSGYSNRKGGATTPETQAKTLNDTDSIYQRLIADILSEDNKPQFISTGEDDFTKNILATFAAEKRDEASGSELLDLDSMFDGEGNFINSKSNRKKLTELYGDDLAEFGQTQLDERLSELADKNQPLANLSVDDRKLLSGVLTSKLEDAGTKVGGHFLKRLNEGDAETFNKALGSIGSVKQTALPEELSTEISRLRDEIKTLSDSAIQASNKAEFAETSKQIKARKAKIDSIRTLGKDIAKLENDLQAASENLIKANATDNTDKIVNASDKVSTLQSQLDKKQSELQQILSPQVQDATPKTAPPANQQTADFMANLNAEIQTLKSQLTPDLPREQVQPLAQQIKDKTAQLDKINKLNAQLDTLTTQAAEAYQNLQNPEKQDAAIEQLSDATKKIQAAESELQQIISPQIQDATPAPSKKFAPVKAKADEKISTLNQQIDALRLQDETANAAEIERLTDKRYEIQAVTDELAQLDAQFQPLIQARNEADKNNDAKAYNAAKRKVDALSKQYKQKSRALDKLINPQETPQKSEKQPETYPTSEEVQAKIDEINARIRELRNSGEAKNSADISKLSRQANAMKSASKKVGQLTVQRDQAELDGNSQVADQLTGKIADWNKKIDKATKRADEVLNPPQKPAPKEKPQPPAKPVNHQTAQTISRLENDIAQLDDKLMSDLPEEQYAAVKAQYDAKRARLEQIKSLNEQIAAAQKQKDEIRTDAKKARESNDEATSADLRQQYQNVNEQQKQAQAELDDLLFEPANDEVAEAVAKLNAEIRELENKIAKSNSRDEKKSLTEKLTAKKNRLKNILDANQKVIATRKKLAITDQNGDSSNYAEAFSANEQAEKELDKYLNPPAPKEKKPAKAKTEKKSAETTSPTPEQSQSTPKKIKPKPPAQESTQPAPKTETQPETQPETKSEPQKSAQRDEEYTTDDGRIFSSLEDSERNLKEAFADFAPAKFNDEETAEKDDEIPADKFINVVDDSDEANEKDIAELHKELRKMSAMPMFNPKVWTLGLRIGIRYLQRGINNFVAWAKKMTQDVGEEFEPWQKALWETLKTMPAIKKFNDKQIWSIADRIGSLYENGTTELEDIEKDFAEKLGEETTKAITPMIRATYKGIQKFFADRQKESESQPQTEEKAPDNKKAAVTVTGDEFGEYDGIDDLRKKAIQYYSENLQGTSVENETLGKIDIDENGLINFTGSGKRELKNSSAKINKLLLVKYLPELIRNSTDITGKDSTKDRHKGDYFYYLHTNAQVNDKTIPVEITVVKRNNGEIQYYNHTLPSEEKAKDAVVSTEPESSNEALGTLSIPASSAEDKTSDENIPQNAQSNKDENTTDLESTRKQLRAEAEAKAAKPKSDEQANESQSTKAEQSEIVYPDGALTYGDKTAVEKFKRGYSDKNFDTNNDKKVTVDGREMTRLEVVEGIAKGELDESALKLHKREREYLEWLQKNLLAPLKKIQQAGIQNEQAETHISARWSAHDTVYFEGIEKHAKTLSALSKLAESLGGEVNKNSQGNTSFKFAIPKIGAEFARAAEFFMENVHLPYFGQERVIKNPLAELKNISLPEGVKILKIDIAPNSKGVWRVKFVGKFPANKEPAAFNRKQAETNRLFADLAKHFNGRLYADSTYHFKNKSDAMEFKKALDEHLGLKVTAGTFADNPDLIFNSDAITRTADNAIKTDKEIKSLNDIVDLTRDTNAFVDMVKKVQSLGKEVTAKLKDGTLTRAEAEEIAGDLTDEFENARKQFDAGKITQTEAQDKMRAVVERVENRLAKTEKPETKTETPKEKTSENESATEESQTEQNDKKKKASNASNKFHGLSDEQISAVRDFARFWRAPTSFTDGLSSEDYLEKAVGKETAEKILPVIDAFSVEIIMSPTPAKPPTKSSLEVATERLKEVFGLQTKRERRQEKDSQRLHKKLKTETHPNLRARLENNFAEIERDPNSEQAFTARNELEQFRTRDFTDDDLDELERKAAIEQRAREALKAAGLEGKTAPEKYHSRQPYEHGNQYLVEILTKEKPDSNIKRNITKLANQFGGFKVEDPNSVAWGYYFYEDEKEAAQAFKKALDIYFENAPEKLTPEEKFARKVDNALEKLKAAHDFSDEQIKWVDRFGKRLKNEGEITVADFDIPNTAFKNYGGFTRINKIFGDKLTEIIDELNGYVNEEAMANGEESGTGKRTDDGHRDVEPAVRTGTETETRTQGRIEIAGVDSGQERQTQSGLDENATRTNAENARPVREDEAGSTSTRTGERAGLRGNSETVQPAPGTERGNARISEPVENVSESAKGLQRLHEKLKTDKRPNLKRRIENHFAEIERDPKSEKARNAYYDLRNFTTKEFTDEELDTLEKAAQIYSDGEALYEDRFIVTDEELQELHRKLQTDTHPHLKELLDEDFQEINRDEEESTLKIFDAEKLYSGSNRYKKFLLRHFTDEDIDEMEKNWQWLIPFTNATVHYGINRNVSEEDKHEIWNIVHNSIKPEKELKKIYPNLKAIPSKVGLRLYLDGDGSNNLQNAFYQTHFTEHEFETHINDQEQLLENLLQEERELRGTKKDTDGNVAELGTVEKSQSARETKPYETAGHNFQITEDSGIGDGGLKTKFKQNIDAIKLLKQLEREERKATPSEQEILAKFNGWGTLAPAFSNAKDWQKENQELRELLTDEEYAAARGAIRNAFYTSPEIAKTIWSGLKRLGFTGGRILDPSMGSGIFFGTMPSEIAVQSALTGVELDSLTGRIAQQLYQGADIEITGFQNRNLPDNYFDLAISNVPFDSVRILEDPKYSKANLQLHDYFFAKSMDKIRPGGLVAFITSTGTLNEPRQIAKLYDGKADLIAAFKLPSQTFDKNAGTQVTTDIVIFQKRIDPDKASEHAQEWTKVTKNFSAAKIGSTETKRVKINEYFINHPDHMIGTPVLDKLYAGSSPRMGLDGKGRDVVKELGDLMNKLPENIYLPIQRETPSTLDNTLAKFSSRQTEGDFAIVGGKVYQRQDGKRVEVADKDAPTVKDYLGLAKILERLLSAQLNPDTTDERLSELRKNLNQKYDAFVKNHGYLNAPQNVKILSEDSSFGRVAAIENYHVDKKTKQESSSKTDIFFKRTATPIEEPTTADTAIDGLTLSLAMRGRVDMQYISSLTGKNESELERELGDWLYKNPETNEHELAEEYLSGNVREKYSQAKEAAKKNPAFNRNVEALKKVIPLEVPADGIAVQLGTTWIDPKYYEDFVRHMLGDDVKKIKINLSNELGKWFVEGNARSDGSEFRKWTVQKAKVGEVNFFELLEMALNKKTPSFTTDKKPDEAANAEARAKVERINAAFADWIWADEARMEDLLRSFNSAYNSNVLRNYDGSHLTFPGLARDVKEKLYPHQKDVIWRIMQGKNTLIAHCVGSGKTWSMQIAAMEMKRLGTINKPLFAVPNAIVEQFRQEFLRAYPSARILVLTSENLPSVTGAKNESATDKKKRIAQRERTLNRIVTGDWDGIIISHNLFERLPVSPEAEEDFLFEQIRLLTAEKYAVAKMQGKGTDTTKFVKQLEAAIARLNQQIKAKTNSARREICIPFDELGIDQIFVDEADMFKNLGFKSQFVQRRNAGDPKVVGVSTTNAKRSWDLYMKTRILSQMPRKNGNKGGGVVFATGTPVSNSLSEIFTTMRYLATEELEEKNISFFDGWAQGFVKGIPTVELSPDGSGFESVIRLKMTNLFALINMYRQIADIKMPEDLPHLKRPKLKNDSRTVVEIEQPEVYKKYLLKVQERAQAIHDGNVKPEEDNFLKITNDLKNASLDMRLIDPTIPESEAGAKLDALCDMVTAKYHETADINGTQVIFSDIGVPKGKDLDKEAKEADSDEQPAIDTETSAETVTVYERIKRGLIKRGIPANQIAFVHEAKTPEERQALFNRVNDGEIRVLIGSTEIMGAGVNIQKRLAALHHLTCPWRPRDIEQREGRILRAGNENAEVEIFTYVTKDTFDANMWEKVTLKKEMMDAFLRGDPSIKEIDDFNSEETLGFDDVMNTGITDKSAKETATLKTKIRALTYEKNLFAQRMRDKRLEQKKISARIPQAEQAIKNIQADIAEKISTKGDAFKMKIGKIEYTDRVEAGKAFDNLIKSFRSGASKKVGEIGGFDINMRAEDTLINRGGVTEVLNTRVFVTLSNHGIYSAEPSLRSIEHFISHGGIEMQLESDEKQLKKAKVQLAVLEDALSKPFGKQAELDEAIEALEEIEHRLSGKPENAGTPAQLETTSEETANVTESATQVEKPDEESANAQEISQDIEDSPNGRLEYLGGVTKQYTARTKGEKAIKDAPNGAIIQITAESNDGETRTEYYHVAGDFLERVEANGEQSGESFPQNQKGIKNNMAILDADNFKLKSITITERPADVDTQKLIALLHKNLKTDTHPALKEWLARMEKKLAEANSYERVRILDNLLDSAIFKPSDEELRKDEAYHAEMYAKQARAKESEKISETSTTQELTRQETETKSQTATEQAETSTTEESTTENTPSPENKNVDDWTDEIIFNAGKNGVTVPTADGIIRVTRTSERFRSYTISYEPETELTAAEKETLTDKIKYKIAGTTYVETQGSRIGSTRNPKPITFVSDPFNYGYNYTPGEARARGLQETKKFVKNLKAAIDGGTLSDKLRNHKTQPKLSLRGTGNTEIKNYVEPRTEQQKILQRLGKDLGVRVVFVDNPNKDFHGAHVNGTSVLNVNSEFALPQVFWHETAHWLKLSNPELYRRLVKAAGITDAQRQTYIEETGRTDLTTDAAIDEEIIADQLEDVLKRAGFLRDIGRKDQSLIERVIAWLQDLMSKFREYFQNPKGKLTREQAQRMSNEFGRMAKTIVNRDGKAIFRYNNKTHSVELATGESLDKLYETAQRENEKITNQSDTAIDFLQRFNDNEIYIGNVILRRLQNDNFMNQINDNMTIAQFREKVLRNENGAVSQATILYNKCANANKVDTKELESRRTRLKEALANATRARRTFNSIGMLEKVGTALRSKNKGRKDSRLAETLQRALDGRRAENAGGLGGELLVLQIPGEYRGMYETPIAKELIAEIRQDEMRSEKQGAFSLDATAQQPTDNAALVKQFGGRIVNDKPVFDNARDEADYQSYIEAERRGEVKLSFAGNASSTVTNLTAKIKTAFTTGKNERTHNHMRKLLEEVSGYRIRTGRFAKGVGNDPVDDTAKVIRTPAAYDWDTIVPAASKLVAEKLKLNPSPEMTDYVTRWFVDGATTDNSTEAKDFQRAMRQADDYYRNKLYEVREQFDTWNKRAPEEIVRDTIAHGKPEKPLTDTAKGFFNGAYEQFVEELYPVKQLVDAFEEELHRKLTDEENPYVLLRNYRGMAGRAKIMVEEGAAAIEALKLAFPNINFDNFKTIRMILESCDALNNEERRKQFSDYLLACSVKDLHNLNNANLKMQTKLKRLIEQLEDAMDATTDRDAKAEAREQIKIRKAQLEALKSQIYATPFSEEICDKTIAKYKTEYGKAQQDMMAFQNTLLDIMVDSGILSAESRDEYKARYPNHVPHFRAFDENENVSFGDSLKQMKGSTRDVIDPLESIVRNTYSFIRRAEKNKAKLALVNLARTGGAGEVFDEISKPNGATHTSIPFFEGGKKKYLDTDPAIAKVVNNLAPMQMSWFMKFIRIGTMLLRNFATVYNPAFALRNLVMDDQNAMLYSQHGLFSPADLVRGFLSVFNRDEDFQQWMAMGGAQASFWSVDRDYTQASIDQLTKGKWKQYKSWRGIGKLFSMLGEYSELATRVGYFKKAKKALAEKNGGKIDRAVLITAALESRDLTDFARGGKSSRTWNSWAAFANASIQGWDKFFRTFDPRKAFSKDKAERQQWQWAMFRLAFGSIVPAVLLFMLNHDEDWYEKDLPDWERQTHWCVGEHLRIPKGQDVGLRFFSNLTESILRGMSGDKKAFENWFRPVRESLPDWCPTAMQPIIECMTNYDMFRKNYIVPQRQQNLPEYMQYDSRTSDLAKSIGDSSLVKFFVGKTGLSPEKIDHFIYGYTGKFGREIVRLFDTVRGARNYDFKGVSDVPLIGGFFRTPYIMPRILTEYYEQLDAQTKLHNEFKLTKKRPEGYDHNLYTRLTNTQKEMRKFAKAERKIIDDPSLDFDERDERRKKLQKRRTEPAERALR